VKCSLEFCKNSQLLLEVITEVDANYAESVTRLSEALGHIQFQDVMRQRMEHVQGALVEMRDHLVAVGRKAGSSRMGWPIRYDIQGIAGVPSQQLQEWPAKPITHLAVAGGSSDSDSALTAVPPLNCCIFAVTLRRPNAAWVVSPVGTHAACLFHACRHGPTHNALAPGLEVSRGDVLQRQLIQAQLRQRPLQLCVFLLRLFEPPRLDHLKSAVFLASSASGLFCDRSLFTGLSSGLFVCRSRFNLPKRSYDPLRRIHFSWRRKTLLSYQLVLLSLIQKEPGTRAGLMKGSSPHWSGPAPT
jgi:hypothetical protein